MTPKRGRVVSWVGSDGTERRAPYRRQNLKNNNQAALHHGAHGESIMDFETVWVVTYYTNGRDPDQWYFQKEESARHHAAKKMGEIMLNEYTNKLITPEDLERPDYEYMREKWEELSNGEDFTVREEPINPNTTTQTNEVSSHERQR
jgi:hypothetical protein